MVSMGAAWRHSTNHSFCYPAGLCSLRGMRVWGVVLEGDNRTGRELGFCRHGASSAIATAVTRRQGRRLLPQQPRLAAPPPYRRFFAECMDRNPTGASLILQRPSHLGPVSLSPLASSDCSFCYGQRAGDTRSRAWPTPEAPRNCTPCSVALSVQGILLAFKDSSSYMILKPKC